MKRPAVIAAFLVLIGFGSFAWFHFVGVRLLSGFRSPKSEISSFAPDPLTQQIIAAGNPYASPTPAETWLGSSLIDQAKGDVPGNVKLFSKFEPLVSRAANGAWEITFKP